jgi:hypothetical protein
VPFSNYQQLLLLVCAATLTVGVVLGAAIRSLVHSALHLSLRRLHAGERARLLWLLGIAPAAAGVIAACGVAFAFVRHEPAGTTEAAGLTLMLLAACSLVLIGAGLVRLLDSAWRTHRCHRLLERVGRRIEIRGCALPAWRIGADFPVAAVSGVLRPRLILSSQILEHCSAGELTVIVRHEEAHAARRDNLWRAWLLAMPDVFSQLRRPSLCAAWQRAVEEAADDVAVRSDVDARLALAGALVRVGKMAITPPPAWMPALALYDGDNLESRVRRLLEPAPVRTPLRFHARIRSLALALAAITAVAWLAMGPGPLHGMMEWAVRYLP